ncbi:exosortase/archaeosortase family protein [Candidatus Bathyarchaeota archaeon]|nr:exosortase/archaeosortase family protein [Candidatus Bathyarchaeota archaeon]
MLRKSWPIFTETRITLGLKIATVLIATIALFSQDLAIIFTDALQSETTSYLLAIPFLFAYLVYRKRKMLAAVIPLENRNQPRETRHLPAIAGVLLSITAVLLYWHGSYTFTPLEYHLLALPLFASGLCLTLFNPQTLRQLAFPMAFLAFLIPPPSDILYTIGATLSTVSSEASNALVSLMGIPSSLTSDAYGNPSIIITRPDTSTLTFSVDIACSGIYSLIGFFIFAAFVAYIIRDKPWKKLTILMIGIPLVYLLNIARITIILLIGYQFGIDLALQIFHLLGGWILVFLGTLLLLAISEKAFKTQIFAKPAEKCPQCIPSTQSNQSFCFACGRIIKSARNMLHKSDIAKITCTILSVILLMSIQAPVFVLTNAPIVTASTPSGEQISTDILPQLQGYDLSFWYRDTEFEARAKQDLAVIYLYSPENDTEDAVWATIQISSTLSSLHRWETCLITWPLSRGKQPTVNQIKLEDIQLSQNPPLIARFFAFNDLATGQTEAVLYWYETATFSVNSTSQQKHVMISIIIYPQNPDDLTNTEDKLTAIARAINDYWQPIKTWSQVTMIISQNGLSAVAITSSIIIAIIAMYALESRRLRIANAKTYQKLSKPNRQIIDAIKALPKNKTPTLNNIATQYNTLTRRATDQNQLLQKLQNLEKTGILESEITNQRDEPTQTWKAQIKLR